MTEFGLGSPRYEDEPEFPIAVHVHSRSTAELSKLVARGGLAKGVRVAGRAAATLEDCQVSKVPNYSIGEPMWPGGMRYYRRKTVKIHFCVDVQDSTCRLTRCTLSGSCTGLDVCGTDSSVHASECQFRDNIKFRLCRQRCKPDCGLVQVLWE